VQVSAEAGTWKTGSPCIFHPVGSDGGGIIEKKKTLRSSAREGDRERKTEKKKGGAEEKCVPVSLSKYEWF